MRWGQWMLTVHQGGKAILTRARVTNTGSAKAQGRARGTIRRKAEQSVICFTRFVFFFKCACVSSATPMLCLFTHAADWQPPSSHLQPPTPPTPKSLSFTFLPPPHRMSTRRDYTRMRPSILVRLRYSALSHGLDFTDCTKDNA